VYGELEGLLTFGLAAGGGLNSGGSRGSPAPLVTGQADLLLLSTIGVKLGYETHADSVAPGVDLRQHSFFVDFDVRPLFLTLFYTNLYTGRELLDLFLYSIGLEIGLSYERTAIGGTFEQSESSVGFHIGLGFELPLYRRRGRGLYLRFEVRGNFVREVQLRPELATLAGRPTQSIDGLQVNLLLRYRFQFWENF
jgi:hypothetical protein